MDNPAPPPPDGSMETTLPDIAVDFDIMDEFFPGGGWLETSDYSELLRLGTPTSVSPFGSFGFSPLIDISNSSLNLNPLEFDNQDDAETSVFSMDLPLDVQVETLRRESVDIDAVGIPNYSVQSGEMNYTDPISEPGMSSWIQQRHPVVSVGERLRHALDYIQESQRYGGDVLVQIWVPVKQGDRHVLITHGQPFSLSPNSQSLVNYRSVSTRYQFSTEEGSHEALGLPGRVFLGRVPEWTPDVRYFSSQEYPRVNYAQRCEVRGTLAIPVFERGSRSCLGVVEVVTTVQKTNFSSDLENICNALQAVDLRSSEVKSVPRMKVSTDSYQAAISEICEVLRSVCETHKLPLAQTWISCIHQSKKGRRHSEENYKECVSTVDAACYVNDPSVSGFHDACSEYHLFRGQGVAGKAFTTNQPCFSSDITSFSKIEYPLSHHAKLFNLRAAVAIRLRSIHTGITDFVVEFFLPVDCRGSEDQKLMLSSLSITIQQVCQGLRVVTSKELEDEDNLQVKEVIPSNVTDGNTVSGGGQSQNSDDFPSVGYSKGASTERSSWIGSIMKAQQRVVSSMLPASMSMEYNMQGTRGFSVSTNWDCSEVGLPAGQLFTEFKPHQQDSMNMTDHNDSFCGEHGFLAAGKAQEKRRTKTEKTVSLEVLRRYFAGSLKDAAESIGVCPTTLKRICRQHGITRWPSRKIKKVGHSLRKLQVVIDSVQGAEGTFQFNSLYENFTKGSVPEKNTSGSSMFSALKQNDHPESSMLHQQQEARFTSNISASKSLSSSSCSKSSSSSLACSSETKQCSHSPELLLKQETPSGDNQSDNMLKRANSQVELHSSSENPPISIARSQSHDILGKHVSSISLSPEKSYQMLKVKAIYGEEKIRFSLQPTWGFQDLEQEILKRFAIDDMNLVSIKYLDDDAEWVLLTCDADLEECIDVYKSSHARTIRISIHHVAQPASKTSITPQIGSNEIWVNISISREHRACAPGGTLISSLLFGKMLIHLPHGLIRALQFNMRNSLMSGNGLLQLTLGASAMEIQRTILLIWHSPSLVGCR